VAAPYHRADQAIRFNQEVMDGPGAVDQGRIVGRGIDYVVTCTGLRGRVKPDSFHAALLADTVGPWLTPVAGGESDVIRIWRVAHLDDLRQSTK
jgi:hypothetical protein